MRKIILSFFCNKINVCIIVLLLINSSYESELINLSERKVNLTSNVYFISKKNYGQYNNLIYRRNEEIFTFSSRYENSMKNIRMIELKNEKNVYFMELIKIKMFIGINESYPNFLSIYTNQSIFTNNNTKLKWKLYRINEEEFRIQNI